MDLLGKICRLAVEAGGYRMAWVGYALDDDYGTIKPMAHAGVEGGYLREIKVSWSEHQATGLGPGGRAIRSGKAIVCDDISQDPAFAPFMRVARQRGYRGMICLPLCDSTRSIGILGLYSSEVKVTSPEELNLLQELANDLAFGILTLRARAGQKRLESAVVKVASSVSAATGDHFLKQLARGMAEAVGAQAGFVAQFLPGEPLTARTLAAVVEGRMMDSFTYVIKDTPCETLRNSGSCVIARGVAPLLPPGLEALNAQGYVGWRLDSSTGEPLGQLSVVFREPLQETDFITSTIQIFAARAASEMERNQTDARVRDQAALLENAREAIIERDLEHRILLWNRGAERLYGWTAAEAVGRSATELLFKDPAPVIAAVKATVTEGSWDGELHQVNKQEQPLIVEAHFTLVRDASGNPKSILSIGTDITERKNMEEQFFRAQRLDSIGTLASGLAHDLNNILAPIMMCAPMLRMGLPPAEFESLLRGIEISAERGAQIVRQVLTFGRGVQGERAPLQIGKIIQEIVQIAGETFPKSIRIEPSIAPDLSGIMGDITQWHQVLMNLCVNARDAMADGGVLRVTADNLAVDTHYASMTPGLAEGPHVIIEVSDTGAGIPPDVVSRIFDPFFTTKAVGKGTGLGLSTVLGIVRNHGGAISVDTHPGLGTTFRILIPSTAESASLAASNPQAPIPRGNGQLILIADDEPNVRNAARQVLERQGYRTLLAADGIEAIALFAKHADTIVAVLTDIAMPRMDGIALITAMLRIRPGTPIIASTGEGGKARTDAIKELGVATLLLKPYKAEVLLRAIDAAITKSAPAPDFHGWDV
jgi:PAS domain S-box-containing protein